MIICFDTETTGLNDEGGVMDEVIQLSIADAQTDEQIWNEYFRPSEALMERRWDGASAVTGIYPEDLLDCRRLSDPQVFDELFCIFASAEKIIGYHVAYDVRMMERHGFRFENAVFEDSMFAFAEYYWHYHPEEDYVAKSGKTYTNGWFGFADNHFGGKGKYMSRNLSFATESVCGITDFGAHDSMNDVYATSALWRSMHNIEADACEQGFAFDALTGEILRDPDGNQVFRDFKGNPMFYPDGMAMGYANGQFRGLFVKTYDYYELRAFE